MRRLILCATLVAVATPADACCFRRLFHRRHHRPVAVVHCAPLAPSPQAVPVAVPYCPTGQCPR